MLDIKDVFKKDAENIRISTKMTRRMDYITANKNQKIWKMLDIKDVFKKDAENIRISTKLEQVY